MLEHCTPWPKEFACRYRQQGYWANNTLHGMLASSIRAVPERIALVQGERRLSYAQLGQAIDRLAGRLLDLGLQPLDRVVFSCQTRSSS
jgi:2,3-dihydroxybenzoate-AMP ligase